MSNNDLETRYLQALEVIEEYISHGYSNDRKFIRWVVDNTNLHNHDIASLFDIELDDIEWFDRDDYTEIVEVEVPRYQPKNLADEIRDNTLEKIYRNIKITQKDLDNFLNSYI